MPTRTINLKMIIRRDEAGVELRRALWLTHETINHAVRRVEDILLLCRGDAYWHRDTNGEEVMVHKEEVQKQALKMARDTQNANGDKKGNDSEVIAALRELYEALVPSCRLDEKDNPIPGDAQAANALVSPLMDRESKGGLSVFDKALKELPAWVSLMGEGAKGWEKESAKWLKTEEALKLTAAPGSPPAWVRKLKKDEPWQDAFVKDQEKKRGETLAGNAPLLKKMKELRLLPMLHPPVQAKLQNDQADTMGVSRWDRMAVGLAVAHFLSWESWNHKTRKEYEKIKNRLVQEREKCAELGGAFKDLREYEAARHRQLMRVALAKEDAPYKIGSRAIRAWDRLREAWLNGGVDEKKRARQAAELQTKLRGRFGDPELFNWLAASGREHLWRERDALTPFVRLNVLESLLQRKRQYALFTTADARVHPRWIKYEKPGGSNLKNYELTGESGAINVGITLLADKVEGGVEERDYMIPLAGSGQFQSPKLILTRQENKKVLRVEEYTSAHQVFSGHPGGSEIILDRTHMENRDSEKLRKGEIGPVWFKLTLDVETQAPEGWLDGKGRASRPPELTHFLTAAAKRSKHEDKVAPGLRVMSVDLGLRSFAACSVFELVEGKPQKGLAWKTDHGNLWARHERTFLLTLPGEEAPRRALAARRVADRELRAIKRDIGRLRDLLRLSVAGESVRAEQLRLLMESLQTAESDEDGKSKLYDVLHRGRASLDGYLLEDAAVWRDACVRLHTAAEQVMAECVSEWRRRTRPRPENWQEWRERRGYGGGKSLWMVEHLDRVRRTLKSWSYRGREQGQINRMDRDEQGVFAASLLRHINNLKEDRTKTGADMIIQAARGFVPDESGWVQAHKPCRVILFEDLARYRFRVDRPRRENSQLMKWNQREIIRESAMQAQIYGIHCETTAAGFTSRYHAPCNAPGVRCRRLGPDDFQNVQPRAYVLAQLGSLAENTTLKAGMLVPWEGDEYFATLSKDGARLVVHADLNAAQNLQRRFWTRCGEAYRLPCVKASVDGRECWYPDRIGERLRGALSLLAGGQGFVRLEAQGEGWRAVPVSKAEWTRVRGGVLSEDEAGGEDEVEEALAEIEVEREEGRETFFRDPSGRFFPSDIWVDGKKFWGVVRHKVWRALVEDGGDGADDIPF